MLVFITRSINPIKKKGDKNLITAMINGLNKCCGHK